MHAKSNSGLNRYLFPAMKSSAAATFVSKEQLLNAVGTRSQTRK
jgi:hypothetical protein